MSNTYKLMCGAVLVWGLLAVAIARAEPPKAEPAQDEAAAEEKKPKREPIYEEEPNGEELIAAALKEARLEGKHVLVEWGGNWCGWCYKLHDVFHNDKLVAPIVAEEYQLVLVDSNTNRELMEHYGGKDTRFAYPHLTVLDADGKVLTNQETGSLEIGPKHDPEKVASFLKEWRPAPVDAEQALTAALERAGSEDKRVLVHVGNPYCGWCKVLTRFLHDHEDVLARDYVDLKIDTLRMPHGDEVAARLRPAGSSGVPWMVILDARGEVLATSVGPEGNCGYPVAPAEVEHFLSMLAGTKQRLTAEHLAEIRADLDAFREERERKKAG